MSATADYGVIERLLHRLAFNTVPVQVALADIEDRFLADRNARTAPARPVFVCALPRAGTTLLLNILAAAPEFATHSYRDMPFVMTPILWNRFSRPFRKPAVERERAHGDGVAIGYDSAEAFEEMLWLAFWQDKYRSDHIEVWHAEDRHAAFETFFDRHMRKLIAARCEDRDGPQPHRYLSKNNANIARLGLLPALYPDCRILVPIRDPLSHARSLHRQHRRFRKIHAMDGFARRYMAALGHFEFGADIKPIRFAEISGDPEDPGFWLDYWIAAHDWIEQYLGDRVILVDYATLCARPDRTLDRLAAALGIAVSDEVRAQARLIRPPEDRAGSGDPDRSGALREARGLYERLRRCAINPPAKALAG